MGRCIVVLGIHRSGTSATAGVLHQLGINMGPVLLGATDANRKGHFEDQEMALLNEAALGNWHTPVPRPENHRAHYERLFVDRSRTGGTWGMKDPRLCLVFQDVAPWLRSTPGVDDIRCIAVNRPFNESVNSLIKRDGWSRDRAIQIQSIYQYKLIETIEKFNGAVMGLEFSDLIDDPQSMVAELAEFAFEGISQVASDQQLDAAAAHIDPSLRNHSGAGDAPPQNDAAVRGKDWAA